MTTAKPLKISTMGITREIETTDTGNITLMEDVLFRRSDPRYILDLYTVNIIPEIDTIKRKYLFDPITKTLSVQDLPVFVDVQTIKNILAKTTPTNKELLTAISILAKRLGIN